MPSVTVNAPKTPVTKGSNGIAAATIPNVCKMPGPPAPFVPTPLPNIGRSGMSPDGYSTTVKIEGEPVAIQGSSFGSMGDVASKGTGGGIVSNNCEGPTKFIGPGSFDVKIEGKNVQYLSDPMLNNCGPGGSPPNAATMTGVMQAPGQMAVIYGDDAICDNCKEKTHPVAPGPETDSKLFDLLDDLKSRFNAQKTKIERLSEITGEINRKSQEKAKATKARGRLPRVPTRPEDVAKVAPLEASLAALSGTIAELEAEYQILLAELEGVAVLRWEPARHTFSQGYMVGLCVCRCGSKKLAATSSKSPPGFASAVAAIGYTLASPPATVGVGSKVDLTDWECAAKQIMEKLDGHKPTELIESPFMPGIKGAADRAVTIEKLMVTGLDGVARHEENLKFKSGDATASCDKCQEKLSALYCKNEC